MRQSMRSLLTHHQPATEADVIADAKQKLGHLADLRDVEHLGTLRERLEYASFNVRSVSASDLDTIRTFMRVHLS